MKKAKRNIVLTLRFLLKMILSSKWGTKLHWINNTPIIPLSLDNH
jgi:hypothetical protein